MILENCRGLASSKHLYVRVFPASLFVNFEVALP